MSKSFIKQAEQNVINQARFFNDLMNCLASMQHGLGALTDRWSPGREDFAKGFELLRKAAYAEHQHALARCFAFIGVGGEEAEAFSREQARRVFRNDHSIIQWLDEWNRLPSGWNTGDENGLRAELDQAMSDDRPS